MRETGIDGHPESELIGDRDSDVEDCEDAQPSESQEARAPKVLKSPTQPSKTESEIHRLIHVPFRAWCRECVLGRGRDRAHRRIVGEDDVARIAMDYMFLTEYGFFYSQSDADESLKNDGAQGRTCITVLVIKDFKHKSIWAYPVEGKGVAAAEWLVAQVIEDLDTCGLDGCHMVVKSDQEPSIVEVQKEIAEFRRRAGVGGTALENSRVGDSQSNGRVERAIEELGGLIRTYKSSLESRLGRKVSLTHPAVPWMIKHAANVINCFVIRACGKTSFERIKGRRCIEPIAEFGEIVFFRPAKTKREKEHKDSWRDRFAEGVWLGTNMRTAESIVGTSDGVFRAGAIRRKPPEERWSASFLQELKGCPQQPVPGRDSYRMPNYVRPELVGGEKSDAPSGFRPPPPENPQVRGLYVKPKMIEDHGPTPGCKRCRAVVRGVSSSAPHSNECRDRFTELIKVTPEGAAKAAAVKERLDREAERISDSIMDEADKTIDKKRKVGGDSSDAHRPVDAPDNAARTPAADVDMPSSSAPRRRSADAAMPSSSSSGIDRKRGSETAMKELDPRASNTDEPEVTTELPTMIDEPMAPLPPPPGGPDVDMSAVATAQKPSVPNRQYNRPEQKSTTTKLPYDELQWREIGSGSWARTFVDAEKLILTTRGGPCEADVERRIVRDAITGKLIDDCQPANTPDKTLFRQLPVPTTIRVELIMKDAAKWFRQKNADVAEMYSPPRIVQEAGLRVYGGRRLRPGWSLDLTVNDPETGKPWDLSDGKIRTKAVNLITEGKPFMLILSPMCTAFSQIQAINKERRDPAVVRRELDEAKDHIRWVMKLCALQARANRYFVFEHPASASSWEMAEIKKVHDMEGVMRIKFDMCRFGMEAVDPVDGIAKPIQKQTAILTNSYEVAQRLNRSCPNRCPDKSCHHQHLRLEGGTRCKQAQVYPREFCRAICEGIAAQRRIDSMNLVAMDVMSMEELAAFGHDDLHDNHMADDKYQAYDDVSNDPLIPSLVQAARKEELQYFKEMKVYEYAPLAECLKVTGKQPIGTRWIDTNKGDSSRPNYRSRLVAKEYKIKDQPELYAATPPTECMRLLISKAAEKEVEHNDLH